MNLAKLSNYFELLVIKSKKWISHDINYNILLHSTYHRLPFRNATSHCSLSYWAFNSFILRTIWRNFFIIFTCDPNNNWSQNTKECKQPKEQTRHSEKVQHAEQMNTDKRPKILWKYVMENPVTLIIYLDIHVFIWLYFTL